MTFVVEVNEPITVGKALFSGYTYCWLPAHFKIWQTAYRHDDDCGRGDGGCIVPFK